MMAPSLVCVFCVFQNVDQHLFTFPSGYGQFALGVFDDSFDFGTGLGTEDNWDAENRRERETASRQRYGARQPRSRHGSRRQAGRHEGVPTLEGYYQLVLNFVSLITMLPFYLETSVISPCLYHHACFFSFL